MSNRRKLNLDESRKARAEKQDEGPGFTLNGKEYTLPPSIPAAVLVGVAEAQAGNLASFGLAVRMLFGDDTDEILGAGINREDLGEIIGLYQEDDDAGESKASGD